MSEKSFFWGAENRAITSEDGNSVVLTNLLVQSHGYNSTEMGFLLKASQMNAGYYESTNTSIKSLSANTGLTGEDLMFGSHSFGAYLENEGYKAVPSTRQPSPGELYVLRFTRYIEDMRNWTWYGTPMTVQSSKFILYLTYH